MEYFSRMRVPDKLPLKKLFEGIFFVTGPLFGLLPVSPLVMSYASRDSGVFLYIGWRILNGEIPYLDIWDHKPPVIFFIDALGLILSPQSMWGIWFVEWVFLAAAVYLSYQLFKRLFGFFPALFSVYLWLISFVITLAGGNLTTEYTIPLQYLAIFLLFQNLIKPRWWHHYVIGVVGAVAFLTRQNSIALFISIVFYLSLTLIQRHDWRELLQTAYKLLIGALLPIVVTLAYFYAHNALNEFWNAAFVYNFYYSDERTNLDRLVAIQRGLEWLSQTGLAQLAVLGWAGCIAWLIKKPDIEKPVFAILIISIIDLPLELLFVSISGRPRVPYYLALLPVFSIFTGFAIWRVLSFLQTRLRPMILWSAAALSLVLVFISHSSLYINTAKSNHLILDDYGAVEYIRQNTTSDDYVLMWGAESAVNFFSRRRSPGRFVYQYPLYKTEYAGVEMYEEFLNDILGNKPKLVIVTTGLNKIPRNFGISSEKTDEMIKIIRTLYTKKQSLGEWTVFEAVENKDN